MTTDPDLPVAVIGAGPVGLVTALGLVHYGVPVTVFEEDDELSHDTKAGTMLTRTLEVLHRYGAVTDVLAGSLRVDEIGDIDRATNEPTFSVRTGDLVDDTRFPFVVNIPQHHLEPVLRATLERKRPRTVLMRHRCATSSSTTTTSSSSSTPRTANAGTAPATCWHATAAGRRCARSSAPPSPDGHSPSDTCSSTCGSTWTCGTRATTRTSPTSATRRSG